MLKGGILEIFHGAIFEKSHFLIIFAGFSRTPTEYLLIVRQTHIHWTTEARALGPKKFIYLNPKAKLELGTSEISHFIVQLKVPGSKLNQGEGKKISVKVFVSWSFWGHKGAPRDP